MNIKQEIDRYVTELQPVYKLFANKIEELITSILEANSIIPHSVTSREKDPKSLKNKIMREGRDYEKPLQQITDLAGVRIITYFPTDVDRIYPILEKEFSIDEENSVDKRKTKDPTAFGYASVHLVVKLTPERAKLPEYAAFKTLKCEIQLRTILQHAWAEIEHDIVYKSSDEIPFELRRKFASLAGLLEVADREFEMLRHQETEIRKRIERTIKSEHLDLPINLDSVTMYLKQYHNEKELSSSYARKLVKFLTMYDVDSIQQLHEMLNEYPLKEAQKKEDEVFVTCPEARKCLLRYFTAVGQYFGLPMKAIGDAAGCSKLSKT